MLLEGGGERGREAGGIEKGAVETYKVRSSVVRACGVSWGDFYGGGMINICCSKNFVSPPFFKYNKTHRTPGLSKPPCFRFGTSISRKTYTSTWPYYFFPSLTMAAAADFRHFSLIPISFSHIPGKEGPLFFSSSSSRFERQSLFSFSSYFFSLKSEAHDHHG